jgi:hypothetical protein
MQREGRLREVQETPPEQDRGTVRIAEMRSDRYEIRAVLGRGGMGTVYRAFDTQLQREVALKIPSVGPGDDPSFRERFFREARAVSRIRHPNICEVFDAGQSGEACYIAMALIEGQSLAARLQEGPLDCRPAAELLLKLARALAAVHAAGVIHRDLKPQNVMLDRQGEPLLTDFGLARPLQAEGQMTDSFSVLGTPAYMSPEQMRGQRATVASDIYGLGVILYQVLTGQPPFSGPLGELSLNVVRGNPPRPSRLRPEVDPALEGICLKAMAKRPADRYQSAEEFADALRCYLDGTPQPRAARRRIRWWAWVALSAALVGVLLLAIIIQIRTDKARIRVEVDSPDAEVTVDVVAASAAAAQKTFVHNFDMLGDYNKFLHSTKNAAVQTERWEPKIRYWAPVDDNTWAEVVYRYELPFKIHAASLKGYMLFATDFDPYATGSLQVSADGKTWHTVKHDNQAVDVSAILSGSTTSYIRARMIGSRHYAANNIWFSQFCRTDGRQPETQAPHIYEFRAAAAPK